MKPTRLGILLSGVAATSQPDAMVEEITIDSRTAGPGKLYVAIVGDRFNGNDFAREALEKGAVAAVVSRASNNCEGEQLLVKDTRDALIISASNYGYLFDLRAVAVTGSVGKTTTKEMTGAALSRFGKTLKTFGNKNNSVGFPQTLLNMTDDDEYAAIEIGMATGFGEISGLSKALRPNVAIITCIGSAHLQYFGTRENILKAKLEIIDGLPSDGVLVLNGDDELLMNARDSISVETVTFAIENRDADVRAENIITNGAATLFTIVDSAFGSYSASIPAVGRHNVLDALAAYTAVTRLGLSPERAAAGLSDYVPFGMRQRIVEHDGITVIEDCYNAGPESMKASLSALSDVVQSGVKIAVLGDMLELGDAAEEIHKEAGREAAKQGIDIVLCYGKNAKYIAEAAESSGVPCVEYFEDKMELTEYLKRTAREGDGVLFKASRAMEFEKIIENFYK